MFTTLGAMAEATSANKVLNDWVSGLAGTLTVSFVLLLLSKGVLF